ncbi:MAG: hypothetical protein WB471_04055, partial [Nocardioides sp.]
MPTVVSSTDPTPAPVHLRVRRRSPLVEATRAVVDVGYLLRFRAGTVRHPRLGALGLVLLVGASAAIAVGPSYLPGAGTGDRSLELLVVLPTALLAFVFLAVVSAAASGGGRELIPRDPAAIHPISSTSDHLGALLLAPLNIAWLLQAWALMGVTSYAVGSGRVVGAQVIVVLWLAVGTALGQVVAWSLEGVRRLPHGIVGIRLLNLSVLGLVLGLQLTDRLTAVLDRVPTVRVVIAMVEPSTLVWVSMAAVLAVALVVLVVLGAVPAHLASRRSPRDEARSESSHYLA